MYSRVEFNNNTTFAAIQVMPWAGLQDKRRPRFTAIDRVPDALAEPLNYKP